MQMIRSRIFGYGECCGRGERGGRRHARSFAAAACGFAAVACSSSSPAAAPPIDGPKLEANIAADAAKAGLKVSAVSCPSDQVARVGQQFSCSATLSAGGSVVYDVTITSAAGAYTYTLAGGQSLDGTQAATLLTSDIASSTPALADAKVTCPATVLTPAGHATFECTLAANGATVPISVTSAPGRPLEWTYQT